jgi:hypothetical protein
MELKTVNDTILTPTFATVLPAKFDSIPARVMLLAIGGQESAFAVRRQKGGGPAVSFWQFELGGIRGVMTCTATKDLAAAVCGVLGIPFDARSIYNAMPTNDRLGCAFARLLLYSSPAALPKLGDVQAGWRYYAGLWRPGKPRPLDWPANYTPALALFTPVPLP